MKAFFPDGYHVHTPDWPHAVMLVFACVPGLIAWAMVIISLWRVWH